MDEVNSASLSCKAFIFSSCKNFLELSSAIIDSIFSVFWIISVIGTIVSTIVFIVYSILYLVSKDITDSQKYKKGMKISCFICFAPVAILILNFLVKLIFELFK
jgi:heme/copper-type cytochrome/quinol oxidase subunit 2